MLALVVTDMGDVVAVIGVIVAEGQLAVDIDFIGVDFHIQPIGHRLNLLNVKQIQLFHVRFQSHAGFLGLQLQRVLKTLRRETLVLRICTCVDDGNPGTGAGITRGPSQGGADLLAGGRHIGISFALAYHVGFILRLDQNALDTGDLFDGFDLTIFHVSRDDVGCQGQIPDNVQFFRGRPLDLSNDGILVRCQSVTIIHGLSILGNIQGRIACLDGTGLFQNNGNTHHICISVRALLTGELHRIASGQFRADRAVIDLLERNLHTVSSTHRDRKSSQ